MRYVHGTPIENLIRELQHLRGWDMLDACADGECKKDQIDVCIKLAQQIERTIEWSRLTPCMQHARILEKWWNKVFNKNHS